MVFSLVSGGGAPGLAVWVVESDTGPPLHALVHKREHAPTPRGGTAG